MKHYKFLNSSILESIEISEIKTSKKITYLNIESAFDIETTSTLYNGEKVAFPYIWMFGLGLNNDIYYGRDFKDFLDLLSTLQKNLNLSDERRLIIYVHNLGYEFQFIRKYIEWLDVFSIDERKPIKALCNYGVEFRDSYILSGYSLENTAKNLTKHKVKKLVGDLDYSLIRTTETPLNIVEMGYCKNDIEIILAYINEQIDQYGDINKVPLTNTGRVRKYVKDSCYYDNSNHRKSSKGKYSRYRSVMNDLTLNPKIYVQLKRSFMGGFTHSNPKHTNKVLKNVGSIDLTSSYPSAMLADKYPMSRAKHLEVDKIEDLEKLSKIYCLVFDIKLEGISNILGYESYISESKCRNLKGAIINNGRVFSADELSITITDVDFNIISKVYKWDSIAIKNLYGFVKSYLPKSIIESVLELYEKKTTLKGVVGSEVEYLLSKGMLNSVYGMCVTDIIKDNNIYTDNWSIEKIDIDEKIKEYNESKNRFLFYAWGIWVTAYARRNLWSGILAMGNDYVYSDTDSIKVLNYNKHIKYVNWYNDSITKKLKQMCDHYKIDYNMLNPKTVEGVEKPLGVWEFEGNYTKFKTLGAKRYLVQEGENYSLTVAGLSKKNGINYIVNKCSKNSVKIFNMFNDDLYIPSNETGKMTHTYIDHEQTFHVTDYLGNSKIVKSLSSIHLEKCDFTLSISRQYSEFLKNLSKGYLYRGLKHV